MPSTFYVEFTIEAHDQDEAEAIAALMHETAEEFSPFVTDPVVALTASTAAHSTVADVVLTGTIPDKIIESIKQVRAVCNLQLIDAKNMCDQVRNQGEAIIARNLSIYEAEKLAGILNDRGLRAHSTYTISPSQIKRSTRDLTALYRQLKEM